MKFGTLIAGSFILLVTSNVSAFSRNDILKNMQSMISDQDQAFFNSSKGIWFFNDKGRPIRATLDVKIENDYKIDMINKVLFYLYTKDVNSTESLYVDDIVTLKKSHFNSSRETKFIVHGWLDSKNSKSCLSIKDAYLIHGDYNIIIVDWNIISKRNYVWSAYHVQAVGQYIAKMIDFLVKQRASLDTMTLVGHSLGAHIVGVAGFHAQGTLNYIVGLDPALPLFLRAQPGQRISIQDARYVEIIHTNAGRLGYVNPIGTADFYPNGGFIQRGCHFDITGFCSHCRSYEYFAESINTLTGFYGRSCTYFQFIFGMCKGDVGLMGSARSILLHKGSYFFYTKSDYPYAKGRV